MHVLTVHPTGFVNIRSRWAIRTEEDMEWARKEEERWNNDVNAYAHLDPFSPQIHGAAYNIVDPAEYCPGHPGFDREYGLA